MIVAYHVISTGFHTAKMGPESNGLFFHPGNLKTPCHFVRIFVRIRCLWWPGCFFIHGKETTSNSFHSINSYLWWSKLKNVRKLLKVNPAERLPLNECLEHPWFEVSWEFGMRELGFEWGWLIDSHSWSLIFFQGKITIGNKLWQLCFFFFPVVMLMLPRKTFVEVSQIFTCR